MKRYLFLDIDGVVNHDDWYYKNRVLEHNYDCGDADPAIISMLNGLSDLDVQVVISSSWGDDADKLLRDNGFKLPIVGHTKHFWGQEYSYMCRGNEIEAWLQDNIIQEHIDDSYNYVILDDESDMLMSQAENFVHIDRRHGVTQNDIDHVRRILSLGC